MPENFGDELYKYAFESVGLIALDKRLGNFRLLDYYMIILPSSYFSGKAIIQKYQKLCGAGIGKYGFIYFHLYPNFISEIELGYT